MLLEEARAQSARHGQEHLGLTGKLRDFRAGIKGSNRCTWRGELSPGSYVWSNVLAANLLTVARHKLA